MQFKRFFLFLFAMCIFSPISQVLLLAAPTAVTETSEPTTALPPLPSSQEMTTSYEGAFIRMLVTLLGLIILVFATIWVLRKMGKGRFTFSAGKSIQILEKRHLSPKSVLYLIEIAGKQLLISESQLEVRSLTELTEEMREE